VSQLLSVGSTGPDVRTLQVQLNARPSSLPPLQVDGIFGPKTQARVKEFQKEQRLQVDGIVGPKTQAALRSVPPPVQREFICGTGDPANQGEVLATKQALLASLSPTQGTPGATNLAAFGPTGGGGFLASFPSMPGLPASPSIPLPAFPSLPRIRHLTPAQETDAKAVYGSSLDFAQIFISNKKGPTGRPFTMALRLPGLGIIQVMNLGTFSPSKDLLIHELAHVWQSQHHSSFAAFEPNALGSQAAAAAANAPFVVDPTVSSHKDWPSDFPFSAYAYEPGKAFTEYAAEQIAQQVEKGEAPIVAHVKSAAKGSVDPDNVKSLATIRIENRFKPSVKI